MSSPKVLFGFHALGVRLQDGAAIHASKCYFEPTRRDARMRQFLDRANEAGVQTDRVRRRTAGQNVWQAMVTRAWLPRVCRPSPRCIRSTICSRTWKLPMRICRPSSASSLCILVLDGVTDPHNLGACLRVADGAGAHAVIAPKDHAAGINATVAKVASGAAETVPYFMVTNLARTLNELKERNIWIIGTSDTAPVTLYQADLKGPVALVLGAEGAGMRQLTAKTCDALVSIPMRGAVESLNVSVASGVCLYEALRQRTV
jgi:23S rRNA (guanosine2251-2'-O)-methyltransferase